MKQKNVILNQEKNQQMEMIEIQKKDVAFERKREHERKVR